MYLGECQLLRWLPWSIVGLAVVLTMSNPGAVLHGTLVAAVGVLFARLLPWRYAITDDRLALWFAFGPARAYVKDAVTIRADRGGAIARIEGRRVPYALTDGLVEHNRLLVRAAFLEHGFAMVTR